MTELGVMHALVLGILQGLTEFLPVSSSGHLIIARELFGLALPGLSFEVLLHVGTALAVVVVLRRELKSMLLPVLSWRRAAPGFGLALRLMLASVPAVVVAALAGALVETHLASARTAAAMLLFTALILIAGPPAGRAALRAAAGRPAHRRLPGWRRSEYPQQGDVPSYGTALLVGLAQAVAIIPGISRSGSTVVAALRCGMTRDAAARFSLLLSLPVIFGGAIIDVGGLLRGGGTGLPACPAIVGVVAAFGTGIVAANLLLAVVRRARLGIFGGYCAIVGLLGLWLLR